MWPFVGWGQLEDQTFCCSGLSLGSTCQTGRAGSLNPHAQALTIAIETDIATLSSKPDIAMQVVALGGRASWSRAFLCLRVLVVISYRRVFIVEVCLSTPLRFTSHCRTHRTVRSQHSIVLCSIRSHWGVLEARSIVSPSLLTQPISMTNSTNGRPPPTQSPSNVSPRGLQVGFEFDHGGWS